VTSVSQSVLALSKSIPELDGLVARTRDDLTVVSRESNREDISLMSDESASGESSVEIPETEGTVPRARKGELTVTANDDVLDEVVVSLQTADRDGIVAGILTSDLREEEGTVTRSSENGLRSSATRVSNGGSGNSSHPAVVALNNTTKRHGLSLNRSNCTFRSHLLFLSN